MHLQGEIVSVGYRPENSEHDVTPTVPFGSPAVLGTGAAEEVGPERRVGSEDP